MFQFLGMLKGAMPAAKGAMGGGAQGGMMQGGGGNRFGEAMGNQMAQRGGPAGKIGMSYVNDAKHAPALQVPNMKNMLAGIPVGQQQRAQLPTNMNAYLLHMLNGGM